jgi:hypothetical protein
MYPIHHFPEHPACHNHPAWQLGWRMLGEDPCDSYADLVDTPFHPSIEMTNSALLIGRTRGEQ